MENKELIRLILNYINSYNNKLFKFPNTVQKLDGLIDELDFPSQESEEKLRDMWDHLEEINAVVLDESNNEELEKYSQQINTIFDKFKKHLQILDQKE
jgi:hypothetical protein